MATFFQQAIEAPVHDDIFGGIFYDNINGGANALCGFSPVSLGTPTDVTNAIAAGVTNAVFGSLFVPTPLTNGLPTSPIFGVAMESTYSGKSISVCTSGVFPVIADAAIAAGSLLFAVDALQRTNLQTPFTNVPRLLNQVLKLPNGSTPTLTYDIITVDDPVITGQTSAATVQYFPLGIAMAPATAQYDIIPCKLIPVQFWA